MDAVVGAAQSRSCALLQVSVAINNNNNNNIIIIIITTITNVNSEFNVVVSVFHLLDAFC